MEKKLFEMVSVEDAAKLLLQAFDNAPADWLMTDEVEYYANQLKERLSINELPAPATSDAEIEKLGFTEYPYVDELPMRDAFIKGYKSATPSGWTDKDMCEFAEYMQSTESQLFLNIKGMQAMLKMFKTRNK